MAYWLEKGVAELGSRWPTRYLHPCEQLRQLWTAYAPPDPQPICDPTFLAGMTAGASPELSSGFLLYRDRVMAMNSLVLVGMAAALTSPLRWFLRTRPRSKTLSREAFFWRLQRDLRKQKTIG